MAEDKQTKSEKTVRVTFHASEADGGADDIFVSVNGKAFLLRREEEVDVPEDVLKVLDNAVEVKFDKKMKPRRVKRFPYSVVKK